MKRTTRSTRPAISATDVNTMQARIAEALNDYRAFRKSGAYALSEDLLAALKEINANPRKADRRLGKLVKANPKTAMRVGATTIAMLLHCGGVPTRGPVDPELVDLDEDTSYEAVKTAVANLTADVVMAKMGLADGDLAKASPVDLLEALARLGKQTQADKPAPSQSWTYEGMLDHLKVSTDALDVTDDDQALLCNALDGIGDIIDQSEAVDADSEDVNRSRVKVEDAIRHLAYKTEDARANGWAQETLAQFSIRPWVPTVAEQPLSKVTKLGFCTDGVGMTSEVLDEV